MEKIVITGLGAVSPIGNDVATAWKNAKEGVSGVAPITYFDASDFLVKVAAEVKNFNPEDYLPAREARRRDRYELFSAAAVQEALKQSGLETEFPDCWFRPMRLALTDANAVPLGRAARWDERLFLEIEGDIADYDPQLCVGYAVHAETGELLYWSEHTDGPMAEWPVLTSGRNLLRAELPRCLLNEGSYRISLLAGYGEGNWAVHPGAGGPAVGLLDVISNW